MVTQSIESYAWRSERQPVMTQRSAPITAAISCHIFFHGNLEHPENSAGRRLISLLSPKQNLILFTKGKNPIYIYGNKDYLPQAAGTAGYSHPHRQCQKR